MADVVDLDEYRGRRGRLGPDLELPRELAEATRNALDRRSNLGRRGLALTMRTIEALVREAGIHEHYLPSSERASVAKQLEEILVRVAALRDQYRDAE